ncbi:transposase [Parathermosynechococcus lividus]
MRKQAGVLDRGSKFILLRNDPDLMLEETVKLEQLLQRSKRLEKAYRWKQELCGIDKKLLIIEEGKHRIQEWLYQTGAICNPAIIMIGSPLDGSINYLRNHTMSGVTAGINNRIKLIKRQAHSFVNFNNFRERLLACFSKLVIVITILTGELFS